jgi:hypothetical protein
MCTGRTVPVTSPRKRVEGAFAERTPAVRMMMGSADSEEIA